MNCQRAVSRYPDKCESHTCLKAPMQLPKSIWTLMATVTSTILLAPSAIAQLPSAAPLAVCTNSTDATTQSSTFYRFRYNEPGGGAATNMDVVRVDMSAGASAATETALYNSLYTTVAAGTAADGTVYAMESPGTTPRAGASNLNLLRYDAAGATALGKVTGLPGLSSTIPEMGAAANAADIDRSTGDLIIGILRTGGSMATLYRVNLQTLQATPINLTSAIPGNSSGDFVLDPTGKIAYGLSISTSGASTATSYFWKADLTTGAVTTIKTYSPLGSPTLYFPIGGAAWLANGNIAFTANNSSIGGQVAGTAGATIVLDLSGNQVARYTAANTASTDASRCVPMARITKLVLDANGQALTTAPAGPYPFTVSCPTNQFAVSGSITLANGQNTGIGQILIPENFQACVITEDTNALPALGAGLGWAPPSYQQLPASIPQAGPISASITNTAIAQAGKLTITKTILGGLNGASGTFNFALNCSPSNAAASSASVTLNQATSGSVVVDNIPVGDTCTVTEQTPPVAPIGFHWDVLPATVSVGPMPAGGSLNASVTNTLLKDGRDGNGGTGTGTGGGMNNIPVNNAWALSLLSLLMLAPWGVRRYRNKQRP